jgi:hypothetical protein
MRALRILLLINAVATLAAGVVLFAFPAAIPATMGIELAADQRFVAWLLGAAEIGISALCVGALRTPEPAALRLAAMTLIVFHAGSAAADVLALLAAPTLPVWVNLALRLLMVALFAAFGLRR